MNAIFDENSFHNTDTRVIGKGLGAGPEHAVRCGVWLDDARDFYAFNEVFRHYFGEHPPARACVESRMVVDCKVEVDCVAYKRQAG